MEDQPDQLPQINGEDFYEKIEAPKFVDFTVPDRCPPNDRYWFCLRVGCDQKHEEELDPEEIEKSFVLRVMAARSPYIRFRKALSRKPPSSSPKCPLTAPAKPSKSRIPRLVLISSISRKLVDEKHESRPLSKLNATPKANLKRSSSAAKAFTTPRNRKRISNPDKFRSVQNPKAKSIAVPKARVIAKALVFHSPKRTGRIKTSVELKTPVGKLCATMSKLEITSAKKQPLETKTPVGKLCAAMSKHDIASVKKQVGLPLGTTSRKQFRGREVKSRVYGLSNSRNHKGQEVKVLKKEKRKKKEKDLELKQNCDEDENKIGSSDMEIDVKRSRGGSLEGCSQSDRSKDAETNGKEECLKSVKTTLEPRCDEHQVEASSETSRGEMSILPSSEERASGDSDQVMTRDATDHTEKTNSRDENSSHDVDNDDKENSFPTDDKENDGENESDEKENASASDGNREPHGPSKGGILGNCDTKKDNQGIKRTLKKSSVAATVAQEAKYRKPKPTNPKPFRFRTDERGILKETNLERKLHPPLKEISSVKPSEKSLRKHPNLGQKNDNCQGESENENGIHEENGKGVDKPRRAKNCSRTWKANSEQKSSPSMHSRRCPVSSVSEKSSERTESPIIQKSFVRSQGIASSRKTARLGVMKERSTIILRHKEVEKPCENGASAAPRSVSRGRRPTTIPKEPNFHSIHVPKSCTKWLEGFTEKKLL